jgi:hypothetical protein
MKAMMLGDGMVLCEPMLLQAFKKVCITALALLHTLVETC